MKKMKKQWKLAACWTLIMSLSAQMVIPGFAGVTADDPVKVTYKDGLCEHHPEHDDECGYDHEHDEECYTEVLKCLHEHEEDCYSDDDLDEEATPSDADEREPENCPHICDEESGCITWTLNCPYGQDEDDMGTCGYVCDICEEELATDSNASQVIISAEYVQELIDALPDAEDITEENADEVIEQLEAIDDAKLLLTDEELELLDFTRYEAAAAALGSVYEVATLANAVKVGDFEVTTDGISGTDYTYDSGVFTILTSKPLTIKNADPDTETTDHIVVRKDVSANVTLAGVNIDVSSGSPFEIEKDSTGSVVITLADNTNNLLKSGSSSAALQKEGTNGSLTIQCEQSDEESGHVCTDECGELHAGAGYLSAGIGSRYAGDYSASVANISITGGAVTTNGSVGIGSGMADFASGSVSDISIIGGAVTVSGSVGIGSGYADFKSGNVSNISISGSIVTASGSIGIGSGYANINLGSVSNISIIGGSVKTSSIGCTPDNGDETNPQNVYLLTLENPDSETVYIDGEEYLPVNHLVADENDTNLYVYLTGKSHTIQIGNVKMQYEYNSENGAFESKYNFVVTGGTEGTDYTYENGVLTILTSTPLKINNLKPDTATTDRIVVKKDVSANVTLAGVNIDVSEIGEGAFMIEDDSTGNVTVTLEEETENILCSYSPGYADLQKNGVGDNIGILTINGMGTLIVGNSLGRMARATSRKCGAGIGGGQGKSTSNIEIISGTIIASNYGNRTGIGGGDRGSASNIKITGGTVTAISGENGTGIGGGFKGSSSNISITGGSVLASSIGCTPDNGNGENVYLLTLTNPNSESVYIDGEEYLPVNHLAADENDTNLYVYLTGTTHTVKIGDTETHYHFDEETHTFVEAVFASTYTSDKDGHWYACTNTLCEIKGGYEKHNLNGNGICGACGYDGTAPTGEISIGTNKWNQFLSELTFDVFFKESQTVSITANDNSGKAVTIGYLLSDQELTEEALKAAKFTAYNEPVTISPDNRYIIYAKMTDSAGNVAYINTTGIVLDGTAPVISGIEDGKTYCESQTVTINETNLASVTVNDSSVGLDKNGQFLLSPAEGVQNIIAKDQAGNQTEISVTVNDGHTPKADDGDCTTAVMCQYCEEVAINAKTHDFSGKWNVDSSGHWHVCENAGCKATDTKISHSGTDDSDCTTEVKCECGYVITEANTNHNWGEWTSDGNGKHFRKCLTEGCTVQTPLSDCNDNDKDHLCDLCKASLSDHSGGTATCTDKAVCEYCGEKYGNLDPANHVGGTEVRNAKDAICTEDGYTGDIWCKGCQTELSKGNAIPKKNHVDEDKDHICDRENCDTSLSDHSGGTATCTDKAVCEYCGEEYGDIDHSNHSQIQHIEALKATVSKEGHIEYWYCAGCGTYFADEALTQEIHQEDTVIPKKENPHSDEEGYSENSGILNDVNRIFTDVAETDAYYNDILFVYSNGLMGGAGAGAFAPSGSVTGLQLAEILYQMEGRPAVSEAEKAAAQSQSSGYGPGMTASYDAVVWAQRAGIHVEANQQMTREQLVLALYRYAQYKGYDVSVGENTNILSYQDFDQISEEAVLAVQWAVGSGILKDNGNGYLNPKAIVVRAQLAGVLHDFIVKYNLTSVVSETGIMVWIKKKDEITL